MMWHGSPRMVFSWRLWKPNIPGVARQLAALERPHDSIAVADLGPGGVHDVAPALHHADQPVVEHALGLGMQRRVDSDHVADLDQRLHVRMEGEVELLLNLFRQAMLIGVVELYTEGLETPERRKADATGGNGADIHAFEVVGTLDAIGDVPAALDHPAIGRDVVAYECEDHHDDVL